LTSIKTFLNNSHVHVEPLWIDLFDLIVLKTP